MKFSILLFALSKIVWIAALTNKAFKHYIRNTNAKILIKTEDGKRARMLIFNKGKVSSEAGDSKDFDVALVWKDAATGFSVMIDKSDDASFNAAGEGKLKVEGMSIYAQWFEEGMKLVM